MPVPPIQADPYRPARAARLMGWWRSNPIWLRAGLVLFFVVATIAGGWLYAAKRIKDRHRMSVVEQWARFDQAVKEGDDGEMFAALDRVATLDPTDDRVIRYRQSLHTGVAADEDTALGVFILFRHLRANDLAAAAREGRKRLSRDPNDWIARCAVASHRLREEGVSAAATELAALPDPAVAPPSPFSLLFAYDLLRRTGQDSSRLHRFVNGVVVDVIGAADVNKHPAASKLHLIECYLIGFDPTPSRELGNRMSLAAAPVGRLANQVFDHSAESNDLPLLVKLGGVCDRLHQAFGLLHQAGQISLDQYNGLTRDNDERTKRVWQTVREQNSKEPAAYLGLSRVQARTDRPTAVETVRAGLHECGESPVLLAQYSQLLLKSDDRTGAMAAAFRAAEQNPRDPFGWVLAARTAMTVPRRDAALFACRKAREINPTLPDALLLEADIFLLSGDANEALHRLRELGEDTVFGSSNLTRAYARSHLAAGLAVTADDLVGRAERHSTRVGSPAAVSAVLVGFSDADYDPHVSKLIVGVAARWPTADLDVTRAVELARAAECQLPAWDTNRVRAAVSALERVRANQPDELNVAAALAWVRLKGDGAPAKALADATPVANATNTGSPPSGPQMVALGAVRLANGDTDRAILVLEDARRIGPPSARGSIQLALAYLAGGRVADARTLLADARTRPMTPQDRGDLTAAEAKLSREFP